MSDSTLLKPADTIDETRYDRFVEHSAEHLIRAHARMNPDDPPMTLDEARQSAEEMCAMYRHHFREYRPR